MGRQPGGSVQLTNVNVYRKQGGTLIIGPTTGDTGNGLVKVAADNPGLHANDTVYITGNPSFAEDSVFIDEEPSGTLNFKIG